MKKKTNREATIGIPEDYAEELSPLLLPGRRSETGAGWLVDAGEYCGDAGEDCDAGVFFMTLLNAFLWSDHYKTI